MPNVNDVYEFLKILAPEEAKMDSDNIGFLVGCINADVTKILLSLDITGDVISEALDTGAEIIVSHHPLIKSPLSRITDEDITGKRIIRMIKGDISAICMHTNLDAARDGVNDALAAAAGIANETLTELISGDHKQPAGNAFTCGRIGNLKTPCSIPEYLVKLKETLNTNGLRYHDAGRKVNKVAVVGGSGGDEFKYAIKQGCDTFISADIKYHLFLDAKELGINIIDGDHFCTENLVMGILSAKLGAEFPTLSVNISERHKQTVRFYN